MTIVEELTRQSANLWRLIIAHGCEGCILTIKTDIKNTKKYIEFVCSCRDSEELTEINDACVAFNTTMRDNSTRHRGLTIGAVQPYLRGGFRLVTRQEERFGAVTYVLTKPDSCPYCFHGSPEC